MVVRLCHWISNSPMLQGLVCKVSEASQNICGQSKKPTKAPNLSCLKQNCLCLHMQFEAFQAKWSRVARPMKTPLFRKGRNNGKT